MSLEEVLAKPEQPAPPEPESSSGAAAPVTSAARRHTVAGMEGLTTTPKSSRSKRKASAAVGLRRGSDSPPKKGKKAPKEEEEEVEEVKEEVKMEVKEEEKIMENPPPGPAALPQVGTLLSRTPRPPEPEPTFWAAPDPPPMFQPLPPLQLPPPPPNAHPSWKLPSTSLPATPSDVLGGQVTPSDSFTMIPSFSTPTSAVMTTSTSSMEVVGFGGVTTIVQAPTAVEFGAGSFGAPIPDTAVPVAPTTAMAGAPISVPPPEDSKQQRMAVIVSELRQFAESEVAATPKEEDVFDNMLLEQLKEWHMKKAESTAQLAGQGNPAGQPAGQPLGQLAGQPVGQPVGQPAGQPPVAPQAPTVLEQPPVARFEPTQPLSIEIPEADSTQYEEETSSESENESEHSALGSVGPQLPPTKPIVPVAPVIPNKRGNRQTPRRSNDHTCTGCGKKLGTDYSLRRHRTGCAQVQRKLNPTYPKPTASRMLAGRRRLNQAKSAEAEIKRMEMLPAPAVVHECVHEFNAERGMMGRPLSSPREAAMANGRTSMRSPESSSSSSDDDNDSRSTSSTPEPPSPPLQQRSPRYADEGGPPHLMIFQARYMCQVWYDK
ncbi:CBN-SEA-2 protein [Caenorhabditis brenneri]|uniref:CBN-SEA-2 protein n=1 Tax=Caenorhabditis brenneri TaxID=135651 RepID=G0MMY1_CAEBE|nr:CBN-SEA-2 protein [Caenorhabditis brenneri]